MTKHSKSLSTGFQYKGEWLVENTVFLYRPDGSQQESGAAPRFTASSVAPDGETCIGIDADQLAEALKASVDEVFAANRDGSLSLVSIEDVAVGPSGRPGRRYIFRLGTREGALILEQDGNAGAA